MRPAIVVALALMGCGKGNGGGVKIPLGTTGATITLPKGWRLIDTGKFGGKHDSWSIESGESSSTNHRMVSCRTMAEAPTLDHFYSQSEDSCKNERQPGTKRVLDTGAYYVECDRTDSVHVGAAIRIKPVDDGFDAPDTFVHCVSYVADNDHRAIVKSLRTK